MLSAEIIPSEEKNVIHAFLKFVEKRKKMYPFPCSVWYRGQTQDWPLLPSIVRFMEWNQEEHKISKPNEEKPWNSCGYEKVTYINEEERSMAKERSMLQTFVREASAWSLGNNRFTEVEWYHLAQHHGLPTRLLDWTCDPMVALWFAANEDDDHDGYIYTISHNSLECANYQINKEDKRIFLNSGEMEREVISCLFNGKIINSRASVIPITPSSYNLRQSRQASFFTLHVPSIFLDKEFWGALNVSGTLDETCFAMQADVKFKIFGHQKPALRKYLSSMGRHLWSIFPDMDHLAQGLILENFHAE